MSSDKIVYLISGANRGIGFGLAETLARRSGTVVFAGTRDPATSTALNALAKTLPNLHPIKLTSTEAEDNKAAIKEIEQIAGQLDVVIANAGISKYYGPVLTHPVQEFRDHFEVNTLGPLVLFQAAHDLLVKSPTGAPHFSVISSGMGSISAYFPGAAAAYGTSKAAVNFLVKVIDNEHAAEGLIVSAIHPGWVATDMGNQGAVSHGMPAAPVTPEDSVAGILSRIDGATREKTSGRFWNFKEATGMPWDVATAEIPW